MRKILACAGINGDDKATQRLLTVADSMRPDGILFAGGIVAPRDSPESKIEAMKKFFDAIGRSGHTFGFIPGPNDAPLYEFLRAALNCEIVFPNVFSAHATLNKRGEVVVDGLGGLFTEAKEAGAPVIRYTHSSAEYFLRELWRAEGNVKILLLSEPPTGQLANKGSNFVREFVKSYHPTYCIVGGEKSYRGKEEIGDTIVVNPGALAEGSLALVEWPAHKVEMLNI